MEKINNFTQEEKDQIAQLVYEHLVTKEKKGGYKLVYDLCRVMWNYFNRIGKPGPWQRRDYKG